MELVVIQMEWSRWSPCRDARPRCLDWKEGHVEGSPSHLWVLDDNLGRGLDDCLRWELNDRLCLWVLDDRLGWGDEDFSFQKLNDCPCLWVLDDRLDWGLFTSWSRRPSTQMAVRLSMWKAGRAFMRKTGRSSRLQHSYWLLVGRSNTGDTRLRIIWGGLFLGTNLLASIVIFLLEKNQWWLPLLE